MHQRLFAAFPGGWAGAALLLLRVAVGASALYQGGVYLVNHGNAGGWGWIFGLLMVTAGIALIIGLLTPLFGAAVIAANIVAAIIWLRVPASEFLRDGLAAFYVTIMAIVIAFVGPGAFSLDARMFGRREIVIPSSPHSGKP